MSNTELPQGRRRIGLPNDESSVAPDPNSPLAPDSNLPPELTPPASEPTDVYVDVFAAPPESGPVRMKTPHNCAPITLDGVTYAPDENDMIEIPARFVAHVQAFGFEAA